MRRLGPLAALSLLTATLWAGPPLQQRPLSKPSRSGWALVELDAQAHRQRKGLWLSDGEGRPVPFQDMREGTRTTSPGPIPELRLGRDDRGRPSAAFNLPAFPEGTPDLRLTVEAQDRPWIARVKLERVGPGGTWVLWDPRPRPHVWQWSQGDEGLVVPLPAEPGPWRLTLLPILGRLPRLTGLSFAPQRGRWNLVREERISAAMRPEAARLWRLTLPEGEEVHALDIRLRPPVGALRIELAIPRPPVEGRAQEPLPLAHLGALWALPAFESEGTRLDFLEPFAGGDLLLRLPEGAEPLSVDALCQRSTLAFPAEQGQAYFLHLGGARREAPGSLSTLAATFDPRAAERLTLGAAEPDPHGFAPGAPALSIWDRLKGAWPWLIGALTLALVAVGMRLLKPGAPPEA